LRIRGISEPILVPRAVNYCRRSDFLLNVLPFCNKSSAWSRTRDFRTAKSPSGVK
jgi:hypothetical protein